MCYETSLTKTRGIIESKLKVRFDEPLEFEPYYQKTAFGNPNLHIIKMDEPNTVYPALWGLVPKYAMNDFDTFKKSYNTYNARQETILTSKIFGQSIRENRCIIIADGFFEPHHENNRAKPYYCYIPSKEFKDGRDLFFFAGVFTEFDEESCAFTCAILTTEANSFFAEIHNRKKRMPFVLNDEMKNEWFAENLSEQQINEILKNGFTRKKFKAHEVHNDFYKREIDTNKPFILDPVAKNTLF